MKPHIKVKFVVVDYPYGLANGSPAVLHKADTYEEAEKWIDDNLSNGVLLCSYQINKIYTNE